MIRKNSSERIICARCKERQAVQGFDKVPVCRECSKSEERNLTTIASTGDLHGTGTKSLQREGS